MITKDQALDIVTKLRPKLNNRVTYELDNGYIVSSFFKDIPENESIIEAIFVDKQTGKTHVYNPMIDGGPTIDIEELGDE